MEYTWWVVGYLILSVLCFYIFYMNAVEFGFRLDYKKIDDSTTWRFIITEQREILKLLRHDFLRLHCPWSKKTSIKYRVEEAHQTLLYSTHEKGWTAEDCHNPANHTQIAHDCFVYRSTFWLEQLVMLITSPIYLLLLMVVLIVALVGMIIYEGVKNSYKFVFSKT